MEVYEGFYPDSLFTFDLQLFASPEDEGRTEEPTEYRLRKAREEGNVPRSPDLGAAITLLLTFVTFAAIAGYAFKNLVALMRYYFENIDRFRLAVDGFKNALFTGFEGFLGITLPVFAVAIVVGIISNGVQTGFLMTWKRISLDITKVFSNIPANFRRLFFSRDAVVGLVKSIFKVLVVGLITYFVIKNYSEDIVKLPLIGTVSAVFLIAHVVFKIAVFSLIALLAISVADFMYQRWAYRQSLKMTVREIREELREFEGDPYIKSRLREMAQQILSRVRTDRAVAEATVVVTNPTHFAVALKYEMYFPAPVVVAKGIDAEALRIKKLAEDKGVPVVENRFLARALYETVEVGMEIPVEFYTVVSEIIANIKRDELSRMRQRA